MRKRLLTTWNDDVTPELLETLTGVDCSVKKLITPAQAKKAGVPEDLVVQFTHRPDNGFKLVHIDENKLATKLFGEK